ncbi:MAG: hypothetical protein K5905_04655 [Roseibium sp.]|uniref:hypothetical protein n=1 Tax=Roseibium sp. TaxID=1936156 RepID=UPI0026108E43|nr:hypothetical protein [Roseibium sp.]MCV0424738.1 hypothetical protein [Roseibium sp.]
MQPFRCLKLFLFCLLLPTGAALAGNQPNHIDFAMWFQSGIRDTPECDLTYQDDRYDFGPEVTNPAMSCPDSFAWKLFTQVVRERFWENWTSDRQAWPSDPWPRCLPGGATENCCSSLEGSNDSLPEHCPVFPGEAKGVPQQILNAPSTARGLPMTVATGHGDHGGRSWSDVPNSLKTMVIGNLQKELVFRNRHMMNYIFDRQLYHVEGLKAVYQAFTEKLGANAPYRPEILDPTETFVQPQTPAVVQFPIKSIVVKSNWMSLENARKVGLNPDDTRLPFIKMDLVPKHEEASAGKVEPHILIAFHIVSKDLPNWYWSTFEHASNLGRCDWTGCNDSFGFGGTIPPHVESGGLQGAAANYIPPHQLKETGPDKTAVFDLAKSYAAADRMTRSLASLLAATGIATSTEENRSGLPVPEDAAWRSYRLKGTQTDFVSSTGRATLLGNSVTEAGLVNTSSCISCHARAAIDRRGLVPFGMRINHLNYAGISESATGVPEEGWFYVNAYYGVNGQSQATEVRAIQSDFVFGIRNACPMTETSLGPSRCAKVSKTVGNE